MSAYPLDSVRLRSGVWIARSRASPAISAEGASREQAEERLATLLMLDEVTKREAAEAELLASRDDDP